MAYVKPKVQWRVCIMLPPRRRGLGKARKAHVEPSRRLAAAMGNYLPQVRIGAGAAAWKDEAAL